MIISDGSKPDAVASAALERAYSVLRHCSAPPNVGEPIALVFWHDGTIRAVGPASALVARMRELAPGDELAGSIEHVAKITQGVPNAVVIVVGCGDGSFCVARSVWSPLSKGGQA